MPQLRKDPVLKQWVIISPERGKRPLDFKIDDQPIKSQEKCPFCEGNETLTPPETLAFRKAGTPADSPGWWIRIFSDNEAILQPVGDIWREGAGMFDLMNSFGIHEVVVDVPGHEQKLFNVEPDQVRELVWALKQRLLAIKKNPVYKNFMIVKNSGIGASTVYHSHAHIIATPIIPKRIEEEIDGAREYFHYHDRCIFCDIVRQEIEQEVRVISIDPHFITFCPFASRFPFETYIVPRVHQPFFENIGKDLVDGFAKALQSSLKRIQSLLPGLPYNFILHTSPISDSYRDFFHWHLEIIPKLTQVAGFEWGSGFYINPTPPEDAAKLLREMAI